MCLELLSLHQDLCPPLLRATLLFMLFTTERKNANWDSGVQEHGGVFQHPHTQKFRCGHDLVHTSNWFQSKRNDWTGTESFHSAVGHACSAACWRVELWLQGGVALEDGLSLLPPMGGLQQTFHCSRCYSMRALLLWTFRVGYKAEVFWLS